MLVYPFMRRLLYRYTQYLTNPKPIKTDLPIMDLETSRLPAIAGLSSAANSRNNSNSSDIANAANANSSGAAGQGAGACDPYLTFSTLPAFFTLNHKVRDFFACGGDGSISFDHHAVIDTQIHTSQRPLSNPYHHNAPPFMLGLRQDLRHPQDAPTILGRRGSHAAARRPPGRGGRCLRGPARAADGLGLRLNQVNIDAYEVL